MALIRRTPRVSQPQTSAALDLAFAPNFVISTLGGGPPREHLKGVDGARIGGADTVPSLVGIGQKLNGTSGYVEFASAAPYELLGAMTLVWHGIINSTAGYNFLAARSSGNGALNDPFELRTEPSGAVNLIRANSDYSNWVTTATVPVGVPVTIVVTQGSDISTSAGGSCWINGVSVAFTQSRASTVAGNATGNAQPLQLGTRGDLFAYAATTLGLFAGFPRVLPDGQIRALSGNPWQLFAAAPRNLFVPAAATGNTAALTSQTATGAQGTPAPSLSLAISGNSSTAAAGSVTASLSKALTGNNASATAGGVTAALSVSLTGAQTTASAGTVTPGSGNTQAIAGSSATASAGTPAAALSLVLSGGSATANAGTVTASTGATQAVSGSQVSGSAGTPVASLSLAISGNSATASAGAVAISTGATAAIAGNQVTASAGTVSVFGTSFYIPALLQFTSPVRDKTFISPSRTQSFTSPARNGT